MTMTRLTLPRMNVRYDFASRARNRHSERNGQEFLGGFGEGLAAIDSHENGGTLPNLFAAQTVGESGVAFLLGFKLIFPSTLQLSQATAII